MSIHQRIRNGRIQLQMTEEQFGAAVGVSRGAVQQWEKEGGTAPTRKNQPKVADLLGISVSMLLTGDDSGDAPMTSGGQLKALFDAIPKESALREPTYNKCFDILMQAIRGATPVANPPTADTNPARTLERRSAAPR